MTDTGHFFLNLLFTLDKTKGLFIYYVTHLGEGGVGLGIRHRGVTEGREGSKNLKNCVPNLCSIVAT